MDDSHTDSWWLDCFKFMVVSGDCRLIRWLFLWIPALFGWFQMVARTYTGVLFAILWCSQNIPVSPYPHTIPPYLYWFLGAFSPLTHPSFDVAAVIGWFQKGYDLMDLAPELHGFLSKFHLSAAMMTELLQKQMLSGGLATVKWRFGE